LDAMQQVSFPDINSSPEKQAVVPPMKMVPIPGIPEAPGSIDPKDGVCMAPPRPVLWMKSPDGTGARASFRTFLARSSDKRAWQSCGRETNRTRSV
jgi:hypothetical protein